MSISFKWRAMNLRNWDKQPGSQTAILSGFGPVCDLIGFWLVIIHRLHKIREFCYFLHLHKKWIIYYVSIRIEGAFHVTLIMQELIIPMLKREFFLRGQSFHRLLIYLLLKKNGLRKSRLSRVHCDRMSTNAAPFIKRSLVHELNGKFESAISASCVLTSKPYLNIRININYKITLVSILLVFQSGVK